jgi:hypothetical protein
MGGMRKDHQRQRQDCTNSTMAAMISDNLACAGKVLHMGKREVQEPVSHANPL